MAEVKIQINAKITPSYSIDKNMKCFIHSLNAYEIASYVYTDVYLDNY